MPNLPFQILASAEPTSIQSLPWVAHIVVALGLGAGMILWLSGAKLMKPAFALLGGVIGGSIGFLMLPSMTTSVFSVPSPYIGLAAGGAIGLLAGITLFRFAVAITTGLACFIAGLLISATYLHFAVGLHTERPSNLISSAGPPTAALTDEHPGATRIVLDEGVKPLAERVRVFAADNTERLRWQWKLQTEHNQVVMGVSGLGAGLFGFFTSLFWPRRSTVLATALFGSALTLGSAVWLLAAVDSPGMNLLDRSGPVIWLAAWLVAAVLGMIVQMRRTESAKEAAGIPA